MIDQVVQGMLEGAGQQLPFDVDGDDAQDYFNDKVLEDTDLPYTGTLSGFRD